MAFNFTLSIWTSQETKFATIADVVDKAASAGSRAMMAKFNWNTQIDALARFEHTLLHEFTHTVTQSPLEPPRISLHENL
jgi:hypothetical protein